MRPIEAWAQRHNVPLTAALKMQRLFRLRHKQGVKACNGEQYGSITNQNDCASAWESERNKTDEKLDALGAQFGMVMDYGTGLWGSIMKDGHYIDSVPDA